MTQVPRPSAGLQNEILSEVGSASEDDAETSGDGQGFESQNDIETSAEVEHAGDSECGKGGGQYEGIKNDYPHSLNNTIFISKLKKNLARSKISALSTQLSATASALPTNSPLIPSAKTKSSIPKPKPQPENP